MSGEESVASSIRGLICRWRNSPAVGVAAAAAILIALYFVYAVFQEGSGEYVDVAARNANAVAARLGRYLNSKRPGAKVFVIRGGFDAFAGMVAGALTKGADRIQVVGERTVGVDSVQWIYPDDGEAGSMYLDRDAFERIMAAAPACDVIISFVGIPSEAKNATGGSFLDSPQRKQEWVLVCCGAAGVRKEHLSGQVAAVVLSRPAVYKGDATGNAPKTPMDPEDVFDGDFLLVHADNVNELPAEYGRLLE